MKPIRMDTITLPIEFVHRGYSVRVAEYYEERGPECTSTFFNRPAVRLTGWWVNGELMDWLSGFGQALSDGRIAAEIRTVMDCAGYRGKFR